MNRLRWAAKCRHTSNKLKCLPNGLPWSLDSIRTLFQHSEQERSDKLRHRHNIINVVLQADPS